VATPIGNLGDLSPRAASVLASADFWLVEDTRVSSRLALHLGIKKPMRVLNEYTTSGGISRYVEEIATGLHAALLTDGGSPAVSDPGALLTDAAHGAEITVDPIPGPSAPVTALTASGFFAQKFAFLGFMPRKAGEVRRELEPYRESSMTLVLFESPHRVDDFIIWAGDALGSRRYCLAREMTKVHGQIFRGELPIIPSEAEVPRRGEFTVVIEGLRKGLRRETRK